MTKTTKKVRMTTLLLGVLCIIFVVLAGAIVYVLFLKPEGKNPETQPEVTLSPSINPTSTGGVPTQTPTSAAPSNPSSLGQPNVTVQTNYVFDHIHDQDPQQILDLECTIGNYGDATAYNVTLHIEADSNLQQKAIDVYVQVADILDPQGSVTYANGIVYQAGIPTCRA